MRGEIVPGAAFPDSELPDHTDTPRRLSQLQGDDPMVIALNRIAQRDLEVQEYTDPRDPRIPRTIVLKPGRRVFKIYNGSCDWVRPSTAELQRYEIRVDGEVAGFTACGAIDSPSDTDPARFEFGLARVLDGIEDLTPSSTRSVQRRR